MKLPSSICWMGWGWPLLFYPAPARKKDHPQPLHEVIEGSFNHTPGTVAYSPGISTAETESASKLAMG